MKSHALRGRLPGSNTTGWSAAAGRQVAVTTRRADAPVLYPFKGALMDTFTVGFQVYSPSALRAQCPLGSSHDSCSTTRP
jgi:hypothetical protein